MKENKYKILVGYHKPDILFKDNILEPIHLGRGNALKNSEQIFSENLRFMIDNMIGDETGDNISQKNGSYNEMTGIYWAWKNYDKLDNPDYIGFMHYRRHFIFKDLANSYNECNSINEKTYLKDELNFSQETLDSIFNEYDFVAKIPYTNKTVYQEYDENHKIEDLDKAIEITQRLYPKFNTALEKYIFGKNSYYLNMFIFSRDIFHNYCEWIFSILSEFEKEVDIEGKRLFISERLTGVYIQYLLDSGKKCKFLPTMYIEEKTFVPIVFCPTNEEVQFLPITINSIIQKAKQTTQYEFNVIIKLGEKNKVKSALSILLKDSRHSIKYIDIPKKTTATSYLSSLPDILSNYNKCLFLNSNIIAKEDLGAFYRTNVDDFYLAGVLSCDATNNFKTLSPLCEHLDVYFDSGVLLINLKALKKSNFSYKAEQLCSKYDSTFEQIINIICDGNIKKLDLRNNLMTDFIAHKELTKSYSIEEICRAERFPLIIQYKDKNLPWYNPNAIKADDWFKVEETTNYYTDLVKNKVSIVLTAYNAERFLGQSIESILGQTYKNIELICVDDGSTDDTLQIINRYKSNNNHIISISQKNSGAGKARNEGFKYVTGEYVIFLDADDLYDHDFIKKMVNKIKTENSEICVCKTVGFTDLENQPVNMDWSLDNNFLKSVESPFTSKQLSKHIFNFCRGWAWDKIYATKLVRRTKLAFSDLKNTNDAYFVYTSLVKASKLSYLDEVLIKHRREIIDSISSNREKNWQCSFIAAKEIKSEMDKMGVFCLFEQSFINWLLNFVLWYTGVSYPLKNKLLIFLKTVVFEYFNMNNYGESFFYNKNDYEHYLSIKSIPITNESYELYDEFFNDMYNFNIDKYDLSVKLDQIGILIKNLKRRKKYEQVNYELLKTNQEIPIMMATNDNYAAYAAVTIQSILENVSENKFYNIYVLYTNLSAESIRRLQSMSLQNLEVKCINVSKQAKTIQKTNVNQHLSIETYYRFFVADIFPTYNKMIYVDCDLVCRADISPLYDIELGNYIFGGVHNFMRPNVNDYVANTLKLDPQKYINAGVLLINIPEFKKNNIKNRLINLLQIKKFNFLDQDAINIMCKDSIKLISFEWNYQWHHYNEKTVLLYHNDEYYSLKEKAKIIHYTTRNKAWNNLKWFPHIEFWNYAKDTPFYIDILKNNVKNNFEDNATKDLNDAKKKIVELENSLELKDKQINSKSFKIGRFITWLPRKVRNFFRCLKQNGLRYTMKRLFGGKKSVENY